VSVAEATDFLPIWSCSVWGLPCPRHYWSGGALLPHLFTLTAALPPRRYVFCGTFRPPGLNLASRTLSGTLLCGVRTFLSPRGTREAAVRSGCLRNHYIEPGPWTSDLRPRAFDFTFDLRLQTFRLPASAVSLAFEERMRGRCRGFAVHWGSVRMSSESQVWGL